jgi:hypothetical protein
VTTFGRDVNRDEGTTKGSHILSHEEQAGACIVQRILVLRGEFAIRSNVTDSRHSAVHKAKGTPKGSVKQANALLFPLFRGGKLAEQPRLTTGGNLRRESIKTRCSVDRAKVAILTKGSN